MGLLQVKSQGGASNSSKYFKIRIVRQLLACWIIIVSYHGKRRYSQNRSRCFDNLVRFFDNLIGTVVHDRHRTATIHFPASFCTNHHCWYCASHINFARLNRNLDKQGFVYPLLAHRQVNDYRAIEKQPKFAFRSCRHPAAPIYLGLAF